MTRREFILLLGALAAAPLAAHAQQSAVPVIGYLSSYSPPKDGPSLAPLLKETGYAEGRNVVVEYRFADGDYSRLPRLAAELVDRRVKMIVAAALPAALAAKAATATIPIVFGVGVDPVEFGLVESLNRPRGNLTGVSFLYGALYEKRLGLLHDLLPSASLIGFLSNQNNPNAASHWRHVEAAARALGLAVTELPASTDDELDKAFETGQAKGIGGMLIGDDPYISMRRDRLVGLAARHAIPTAYPDRSFVIAGGLIAYGPKAEALLRVQGAYIERILNGANPADLPVQQPTVLELFINLKTAHSLGLVAPPAILAGADEIIE